MRNVRKVLNLFLYIIFSLINGIYSEVSIADQLRHLMRRQYENQRYNNIQEKIEQPVPKRRYDFDLDMNGAREIIGVPSLPSHLPEAEPILPGHTLIRPALGMLKSSIKFPHKELENGAGVLGNYDNLSIKYDGKNERVLYSGFRRNNPDTDLRRFFSHSSDPLYKDLRKRLADYIMVVPSSMKSRTPGFSLSNLVLDLNDEKEANGRVLDRLKLIKPVNFEEPKRLVMYVADPKGSPLYLTDLFDKKNTADTKILQEKTFSSKYTKEALYDTLNNLFNGRRGNGDMKVIDDSIELADEEYPVEKELDNEEKEEQKTISKREKFYETAKLFNTMKFAADAINFEDLVPELKSGENHMKKQNERPWWFFNQVDYTPFKFSTMEEN